MQRPGVSARCLQARFAYLGQSPDLCDAEENNQNSIQNCKQLNGFSGKLLVSAKLQGVRAPRTGGRGRCSRLLRRWPGGDEDAGQPQGREQQREHPRGTSPPALCSCQVVSTRNNDFSNRSHKAVDCIQTEQLKRRRVSETWLRNTGWTLKTGHNPGGSSQLELARGVEQHRAESESLFGSGSAIAQWLRCCCWSRDWRSCWACSPTSPLPPGRRAAPRAAVPQPTPKPEVYALKHPKSWLFSRRRGGGRPLASAAASPRVRFARYRPRVLRGGLRDQRC